MNIWVIGRDYPTLENKMMGSFELEQAKMLSVEYNVSYLSLRLVFRKKNTLKNKFGTFYWKEDGINVFHCDWQRLPGRFSFINSKLNQIFWKKFLKKAEKELGTPDIIHIHYPSIITYADEVFAFAKNRIKIVCTEHYSGVLTKEINARQKEQLKTYVENSEEFISVGQPLKQSIEEITMIRNKVIVIPNLVNEVFFHETIPHKLFTFIVISRLIPIKQIDKIINAFQKAFAEDQSTILQIVGDGPEKEKLMEISKDNDRILFLGELSRDKTADMLAASDVLICYSLFETFGVPVIEAWASGKPVIVSDKAGVMSYMNDDLGMIISSDDDEKLVVAMKTIKANYHNFDKKKITEFSNDHFSEKAIISSLNNIYEVK